LQQRPHTRRNRFTRPKNARAHSAYGAGHGQRNFFIAQALYFTQAHGLAQIFGQSLHGRVDGSRYLAGSQYSFGRFLVDWFITEAGSFITIVRTGQSALVVGASRALVEVRERVGAEVPLVAGDRLVTSGDGGVFPPGIPVAVVVDGSQEPPLARPFVNPAGLGMVLIESAYLPVPATVPVETSTVAVPREAGGGRTKPSIITSTPRATASALPPPPAPVIAPPVAAAAKPAAPALKYVPRAMNVPLAAPVLSPTDTPAAPPQ